MPLIECSSLEKLTFDSSGVVNVIMSKSCPYTANTFLVAPQNFCYLLRLNKVAQCSDIPESLVG